MPLSQLMASLNLQCTAINKQIYAVVFIVQQRTAVQSHFMKNAGSEKEASVVKLQAHLRAWSQCKTVTIHGHMSKQRMPSQSDRAV